MVPQVLLHIVANAVSRIVAATLVFPTLITDDLMMRARVAVRIRVARYMRAGVLLVGAFLNARHPR
jgi:hypothetical protein